MESNNDGVQSIKIKLVQSSLLKTYEKELERWESEGGNPSDLNDVFEELDKPLNRGDRFEVLSGEIISEEDEFLYRVRVKKIGS